MTRLHRTVAVAAAIVVPIVALAAARTRAAHVDEARVERGRYLVAVTACGDCHTPLALGPHGPQPDMTRLLAGHPETFATPPPPPLDAAWAWAGAATNTAFAGPWGVSYAANLTPDPNTGLGIWTEDMFVTAIRSGKHMGRSRPIAPPMPWEALGHATDEDLKSIYSYLRTIPPVVNHVPDDAPPATTSTH